MAINEWSTTAANNATGVTGVNWAEGMPPSGVNDSARAMMADVATWYGQASGKIPEYLSSVSGTNTITATAPSAMSAYAAGQRFTFLPANTNTGATTLNITPSGASALGAKNVFCGGAACVGGEIRQNVPVGVTYDGTQFNIIGPYVGGNLPAGQIKFPASQNASSDANTLDDYEEGTFTPSVGGSATYTTQSGAYTKVGGIVHFSLRLIINSIGTGSQAQISGLPFTAGATASVHIGYWGNVATNYYSIGGYINSGATSIVMTGITAAGTSVINNASVITNSTDLIISGSYSV